LLKLKGIVSKIEIFENDDCKEEIDFYLSYVNFMYTFLEASKKLIEKFSNQFSENLEKNSNMMSNSLYLTWMVFSYYKKTILKRRNDHTECAILLIIVIINLNNYLKTNLLSGNFELYFKEISSIILLSSTSDKKILFDDTKIISIKNDLTTNDYFRNFKNFR
jgi:hypothetical protein